jgi:hypothetical protein
MASTILIVEVGNGGLPSRTDVTVVAAARTVKPPCPKVGDSGLRPSRENTCTSGRPKVES